MVTTKKKMTGVKIMWIVLITIVVAAAATGGVLFALSKSDSKSEGIYFRYVENEKVQNCWIELQKDNTWINSEGLTGTYTRKGKTITLSGEGLAESMVGTIDGDQISFSSGGNGIIYGQTTPEGATDTEHNFVITLDAQGGILGGGTTSVNAIYGAAMPTLVAPARPGYDFVGYFDQATSGVQYYDATMTSKLNWNKLDNATLYAQWVSANSIILDPQGGTGGTERVEIVAGADMPSAIAPKKVGHTFIGYFDSKEGGTQYYSANMTSMHICDKPVGTIFYARWTADTYNVTFNKDGGEGGSTSVTATYGLAMPNSTEITAPKRDNYIFAGYFDVDGKQYYNAAMLSVNTWDKATASTLFAHWTGETYTVTLDKGVGTGGSESVTATYGQAMPASTEITAPTRIGFKFLGYFDEQIDGTMYYNADMLSANVWERTENATLYAHWTVNTSTVTFEKGDGTGGSASVTATFGQPMPASAEITAPTRIGFEFEGYFDSATGGTKYYNVNMSSAKDWDLDVSTATLYARWEKATDGLKYDYNAANTGYKVKGYDGTDAEVFIPSMHQGLPVTEIGASAFENKSAITSVTIPDGVTAIEANAFSYCTELQTATFGTDSKLLTIGDYAFLHNESFESIAIPKNVTTIGESAFQYCRVLDIITFVANSKLLTIGKSAFMNSQGFKSIEIPANVTTIGESAFNKCRALKTVTFGEVSKLHTIGANAFSESGLTSIVIPASVTTIDEYAFRNSGALTVTFGENSNLQTIGANAFSESGLTNIDIPNSVITIDEYAFNGSKSLKTVTFGANSKLQTIGTRAFTGCGALATVTFGEDSDLQTIGRGAFSWSGLTSITIPDSLITIGIEVFSNCGALATINFAADGNLATIGEKSFEHTNISSITIPKSVTIIDPYAFYGCQLLKTVTFDKGSNLQIIGGSAFQSTSLESINIPASVEAIYGVAFNKCQSLTTVTFDAGSQLKTIRSGAFSESGLERIYIPANVTIIENNAFADCETLSLVSFDSKDKLETIGWKAFFNNIRLRYITLPDSVTTIEASAFEKCLSIEKNPFGAGSKLKTIGERAFYASNRFTSIAIPDSVTDIGESAFANCRALATVNFGAGSQLKTIGANAFKVDGISGTLTSIAIPASVTAIGATAFGNCTNLTIYAAAASKPGAWDSTWNSLARPVVWGVTLLEGKTYIESYTKATIDNPTATGGITAPYREGFTFGGWSTTKGDTTVAYAAADLKDAPTNTVLFAIWKFEVTFDGNGNTGGTMYPKTIYADRETALSKNAFEKDGYRFIGWAASTTGDMVVYTDEQLINWISNPYARNGVLSLHAIWELIPA